MDLKYLPQLTEEELIALINSCIMAKNQSEDIRQKRDVADSIIVYNEYDRRDMQGNQYYLIGTATGIRISDYFVATDYSLKVNNYSHLKDENADVYDEEMKRFMVARFGTQYLDDLFAKRVTDAEQEKQALAEYLGNNR